MPLKEKLIVANNMLAMVTKQRDAALQKLSFSEEEIRVIGMDTLATGGVSIEVTHPGLRNWAISLCDSFIENGGFNYYTVGVRDPRSGEEYEVTMQKRTGLTPIMLHQQARARITDLEAQLEAMAQGVRPDKPQSSVSTFVVTEVKAGTVLNLRCTHCQEALPITKPLGISTLISVTNAFASNHEHLTATKK